MLDFYGQNRSELETYCASRGHSPTHAARLYRGMYKRSLNAAWQVEGLPTDLSSSLRTDFQFEPLKIEKLQMSGYDASVKFLFVLKDGAKIESVLMPEKRRITICLSSQVGCAQACSFCYTGRMGLKRHLTPAEIVGQIAEANRWLKDNPEWLRNKAHTTAKQVTRVVFMGMGEPLDNVDYVSHAIEIMRDPLGLDLPLRHISVSTSGHLEGLDKLLARFPRIPVAISLHATSDVERSRLMPINRRWPIAQLVEAIRRMNAEKQNPILIQFTVIDGINDSLETAEKLAGLLQGLSVKINLIPYNEIAPSRLRAPRPERLLALRDYLHHQGFRTMIRFSKGQDIAAACGQLVQ